MSRAKEILASPKFIKNGLIAIAILFVIMMITNPSSDKYVSTIIQTPDSEIRTSDEFVTARTQTCLLDPILSTLERGKCFDIVTAKRSYMKDFLDGHVKRSDFIVASLFHFTTKERDRESAGSAIGIFNRFYFNFSALILFSLGLIYLAFPVYLGLSAIKLFTFKRRDA